MKRSDLAFAAALVPFDYLALLAAGWLAYTLRFQQVTDLLPVVYAIPFGDYFRILLVVALGWTGVLALAGAYAVRPEKFSAELGKIFLGASTAVLLVIVVIFFQREFFSSRFIIVVGWILSIAFLWITHAIIRGIQRVMLAHGVGAKNIIVFGQDRTAEAIITTMRTQPRLGMRLLKQFPDVNLETTKEFEALLRQGNVDEVIQADPTLPKTKALHILELCTDRGVAFKYAADSFETHAGRIDVQDIAGVPILEILRTPLDGWGRILKRTVDVLGAVIGLVIIFLPSLVIAALIKLDSSGPVFMKLDRVGQGQRRFKLWKFRSMIRDAHALKPQLMSQNERGDGPLFKIANDPRVTRVGRFIRKTSIDELPQLWNVLVGDISLVGPRPHEPEEVARYEQHHKKLLVIKPGMTGMAQVSGRSNLSFEDEVRLDTYYIEHWSLGLDMQILLRTPLAVINTKTAA